MVRFRRPSPGQIISAREEFIESLTHDSLVIQIPYLGPEYQTAAERLLAVFDQHLKVSRDEAAYPQEYGKVIRWLNRAITELWMAAPILVVFAIVLIPLYLGGCIGTVPEYLERRFDHRVRRYFSALTLVSNIVVIPPEPCLPGRWSWSVSYLVSTCSQRHRCWRPSRLSIRPPAVSPWWCVRMCCRPSCSWSGPVS